MTPSTKLLLHLLIITFLVAVAAKAVHNLSQAVFELTAFEEGEQTYLACGKRAAISANLFDAEVWLYQNAEIPRDSLIAQRLNILATLNIAGDWTEELDRCNKRQNSEFRIELARQNSRSIPTDYPNWIPRLYWQKLRPSNG